MCRQGHAELVQRKLVLLPWLNVAPPGLAQPFTAQAERESVRREFLLGLWHADVDQASRTANLIHGGAEIDHQLVPAHGLALQLAEIRDLTRVDPAAAHAAILHRAPAAELLAVLESLLQRTKLTGDSAAAIPRSRGRSAHHATSGVGPLKARRIPRRNPPNQSRRTPSC